MNASKLFLSFVILFCLPLTAQAEVPKLINYQGKLTTPEGGCLDTTVSMRFAIYSDSTGWDSLWSETQASIRVDKGVFNVLLGSVNEIPESVFTGDIRYLGVKVGDDPEMIPRKATVSVGYAFRSDFTDTAEFALSAPPDGDWEIDTSGFNVYRVTGNVGIGEVPHDSCKLFVQSDSMVGDYAVFARGGTGLRAIGTAWEGTGIQGEGGHAGVEGSGCIGILGRGFYGGYFEGQGYFSGNVGIGTTEPDQELEVNGNAHVTGDLTVDGTINPFPFKVYDSGWFAVSANTSYTKTHNLGTAKMLITLYGATGSDGANMSTLSTPEGLDGQNKISTVGQITATQFTLRTGIHQLGRIWNGSSWVTATYARIIALALE